MQYEQCCAKAAGQGRPGGGKGKRHTCRCCACPARWSTAVVAALKRLVIPLAAIHAGLTGVGPAVVLPTSCHVSPGRCRLDTICGEGRPEGRFAGVDRCGITCGLTKACMHSVHERHRVWQAQQACPAEGPSCHMSVCSQVMGGTAGCGSRSACRPWASTSGACHQSRRPGCQTGLREGWRGGPGSGERAE